MFMHYPTMLLVSDLKDGKNDAVGAMTITSDLIQNQWLTITETVKIARQQRERGV